METTLADRLLPYLRALGMDVAFETPPRPLSGGFDTITMAFRLSGAPSGWPTDLVLRLMPPATPPRRVAREAAAHAALVGHGFPAPRVLATETDRAILGGPFLIMERLPGDNMFANAKGAGCGLSRIAAMPRVLARVQARLHAVPGEALLASARDLGLDPELFTLHTGVERLATRAELAGLTGLAEGASWLQRHVPPPAEPEVVCHGDYHPLNVVMDGDRLSGVVDWAQAIVAEPACDVAGTCVILRLAHLAVPPWARLPVSVLRRLATSRYVAAYRAARPFDDRNLPYFEAMRIFLALIVAGETPAGVANPWRTPHTLAALIDRFERISGRRLRL
jgi:aminoglycoside phosphotransferase (APT) family kinase protein